MILPSKAPKSRLTFLAVRLISTCFALAMCVQAARPADEDAGERKFLERYLCPISQILGEIHNAARTNSGDTDRFLILFRTDNSASYVQCEFSDGDSRIYCEVASGFYEHGKDEPRAHFVSGSRLEALAALGYDLDDSKGNFVKEFAVDVYDLAPLAEFMLRSLYEAFHVYPGLKIGFEAPLVKAPPPASACAPMT